MITFPVRLLLIFQILLLVSDVGATEHDARFDLTDTAVDTATGTSRQGGNTGGDMFFARAAERRRRGCDRSASAQYRKMRQRWQKEPRIRKPQWRNGYRDLTLYAVNLGIRVRVFPFLPDGTLDPEAVAEIERAFADKHTGETVSIHPRLIKLLYKLAVRFEARQITLVSGYRGEAAGSESHHGDGTASDIMIPGVKLPALAKVTRRLGHVGVGYYPVSGFVHLDVREKASYFWVDPSGPGKRSCIRRIMPASGPKFDRRWNMADDEPVQQLDRNGTPLGAIEENTELAQAPQSVESQKTTKN
jgi:uncharacterized protein YcbK (DUF882 family)